MPDGINRLPIDNDVAKLPVQFREGTFDRTKVDVAARTVEMSFSSELPYARWWGTEILDHSKDAVNLSRLNNGGALLVNHNWDDQIGVIEKAWVDGDKGRATVRFSRSARGQELLQDVQDGIRTLVSVGYQIDEMRLESTKDDTDTYRVEKWTPYEISFVAVPADPSVGVGREHEQGPTHAVRVHRPGSASPPPQGTSKRSNTMPEVQVQENAPAGASAESVAVQLTALEMENKRKAAIVNLCRANKLDERIERRWIESGADMHEVSEGILAVLAERGKDDSTSLASLGLTRKETQRYSLMNALRASQNKSWIKAGLELECNKAISERLHKLPRAETSFFVPLDILMSDRGQQRDMTAAGVSGSNYMIGTDNQPGSFIDLLRNTSVGLRMGVTRLSGLVGNVTIPKMTAGNTAYWLADETTQITESQPTIGQLALAPKNVAALTELSHQLMQQSSPDAESLVLNSIARDIGLAVDVGILRGSGASGQPTGIANTGSIGAFTGTSLAAAGLLDAQADVASANALNPGCGFVTTPAVAALLMARPELPTTGTDRMWKGNMQMGSIFDFPAMSSAQMSSATMLFGWWPSVVLAEWGVLELMTNPFSDFTRGLTAVRGWYTCDVGVRYPGAWSYSSSIT
jgi:HK97 family phage major capsid protein/HK97 family phage prohead protease